MVLARVFDISVRFGSKSVFISAAHGSIELRELRGGRPGPLVRRFSIRDTDEVQLFVGTPRPRKVLRLASSHAVDLGDAVTTVAALRDAREVSKLVDRPLVIREEDYREVYFADHAPLLHVYEGGDETAVEASTVRFLRTAFASNPDEVGPEDTTLMDVVNVSDLCLR